MCLNTNICIIRTCWWGFYSANTLNFCIGQQRNPSNIVMDTMNIVFVFHTAHCHFSQGNLLYGAEYQPAFTNLYRSKASTCIYLRAKFGEPNSHLTHLTWICTQSYNGKRQRSILLGREAIIVEQVWCNSHKLGQDITSSDTRTIQDDRFCFKLYCRSTFLNIYSEKVDKLWKKDLLIIGDWIWHPFSTAVSSTPWFKSAEEFYICLMFNVWISKSSWQKPQLYKQQRKQMANMHLKHCRMKLFWRGS